MPTVTLGGEEYTLIRPKGREGRKFTATVQRLLAAIMPSIGIIIAKPDAGSYSPQEMEILLNAMADLSEKKVYEDTFLPGLLMWSDRGLSKDAATKILDEVDDTPMDLFVQFAHASLYWLGLTEEEQEELEDAQKK